MKRINHSIDIDLDLRSGLAVKRLREFKQLTQTEVAKRLGVSQAAISMLEKGRMCPSLNLLRKMAVSFGFHRLSEFIAFVEEEVPPSVLAAEALELGLRLQKAMRAKPKGSSKKRLAC